MRHLTQLNVLADSTVNGLSNTGGTLQLSVPEVFGALLAIGLVLVVAKLIRRRVSVFRRLFLPASIIGGLLVLLLGPQVLGRIVTLLGGPELLANGVLSESVEQVWSQLPVILINVVFAALFLGKPIPGIRKVWQLAGPQAAFGQSVAWGQYVVGITLGLLVLSPIFGMSPMAGALIEIGFQGGHGTSAGLVDTFEAFGFAEGTDLALGLATIGLISGVLFGTAIVNWGVRTGRLTLTESGDPKLANDDDEEFDDFDEREDVPERDGTTDPLSLHFGFVAVAIAIGWLMLEALTALEQATWAADGGFELLTHVPLFPMAMLGGAALQIVIDRTGIFAIDRQLMNRISGTALDLIIVAALGTLSLTAIGGNLAPFVILAVAGIAWNIGAFLLLAPRIIPTYAYERGLGDFGQSMGMTVTGLLLMRMADPDNKSGAFEAFGYKQLLFEPVVGGGLFTAASIPLIAQLGPVPVLLGATVLTVFWIVFGIRNFGAKQNRQETH
ncbi:MAG: sodium/glutamate symporter [Nitriliruptoraceae bacterium]